MNPKIMHHKLLKILLIAFGAVHISYSQPDISFFPHNIDDRWVYEVFTWGGENYYQYDQQVIFDSTDQNGNAYVIMHLDYPTSERNSYYMIDSTGNVYNTTPDFQPHVLLYKTSAKTGDKWALGTNNP